MNPSSFFLERFPVEARDFILSFLPEALRPWAAALISVVAILAAFGLFFAFLTLLERKSLAWVQNRPGPNRTGPWGLLQPFSDAIKMVTKEDIVPAAADKLLHYLAPVVLVAFSLLTFAVLPYGRHLVALDLDAGVLFFFAAGAGTELAIFMAGWSSRNKYALIAAMRALAQLISYELPLLLSFVPVILATGSLRPVAIVEAQGSWTWGVLPHWNVFTPWGAAGFLLFLVAALSESNRSPFDLPEAESELIAGHLTEYSGFKYALFFMAEYFGMTALAGLGVTLFLGGWQAPCEILQWVPSYAWFGMKLLSVIVLFMWVRGTTPRLRMDQLMRLAWKFLSPLALFNLGAAIVWLVTAQWQFPGALALRWVLASSIVVIPFLVIGRSLSRGLSTRTYGFAP